MAKPLADRFWPKVDVRGPDDCWLWTGATTSRGYGHLAGQDGAANVLAHRVAYEIEHGPIASTEIFVCHRCDVRPCCNPAHLFLGTNDDNIADMVAKGRQVKGSRVTSAKLSEAQVAEIRRRYRPRVVTQGQLADEFGVTQSVVSMAVRGLTWAHVE